MGQNTKIEWAHHTFNPWWGCTKVSPGCTHCYAEALDNRYHAAEPHWGKGAPRKLASETTWAEPLRWNKAAARAGIRQRVFCASMADVFDDEAPAGARDRLWALIRQTAALDWLLLTKRPQNIRSMLPADWGEGYANVWLGTTCEDQERANERIPHLLRAPARVRFLSCEPLIGPVDLETLTCSSCGGFEVHVGEDGTPWCPDCDEWEMGTSGWLDPDGIGWVIAGGESGPNARPMHPDWARRLRDLCARNEVPFFFKQWGEFAESEPAVLAWSREDRDVPKRHVFFPDDGEGSIAHDRDIRAAITSRGGVTMAMVGKKAAGRELDGKTHDGVPA